MKVSIVIPTFNEAKVISKCLRSLDDQDFDRFEVIVVDDGSKDKTVDIANKVTVNNYKLHIYRKRHEGPGMARNWGAKKANGKILVFLDADMTFDKKFLTDLVTPIVQNKVKGTFSKNEYVSNWSHVWARCWNINEGWPQKLRHPTNYPDKQKVFRALLKSEFDRVGGFLPGGHYTDDYLSDKLGYEASVVSGAKYYHENPDNLAEIFTQAKWVGKRKYKFGVLGVIYALSRSLLPVSLVVGCVKSIKSRTINFVIFKIVYDLGVFWGICEYVLFKKMGK
ncbi:glycosyltransferase family 2 protein [Candidatus Woesebacteria bacterium]|nr:MAG: glycosyltransferase family 2 protein [Candidatus Woesebacteria bacterium]